MPLGGAQVDDFHSDCSCRQNVEVFTRSVFLDVDGQHVTLSLCACNAHLLRPSRIHRIRTHTKPGAHPLELLFQVMRIHSNPFSSKTHSTMECVTAGKNLLRFCMTPSFWPSPLAPLIAA